MGGERHYLSDAEREFCNKYELPLRTVSAQERQKEILIWRNRAHLFNGVCARSGAKVFTCIPPERRNFVVYDIDCWEAEDWDACAYGRSYDFKRPFFEQFAELLRVVPIPNLAVIRSIMENSDYTNGITGAKNCYLVFSASYNEDCLFSKSINYCKNVVDCVLGVKSELCYDCVNIHNCYNLKFSESCHNCSDSAFLAHCLGCHDCYGCVNLNNKEYHFFNEKCSKAEYEKRISKIDFGSSEVVEQEKRRFAEFQARFPLKYLIGRNNENSSGNYLDHTKDCHASYFLNDAEALEHSIWVSKGKSSFFHCMYGNGSEVIYSCHAAGDGVYNLKFCNDCWQGARDLEYCMWTSYGSAHCFGCISLKKKSYCVFNKQYSKEEYFALVARIKEQMRATGEYGKFFPITLSPFYYNTSEVNEFFPLSRDDAVAEGFSWRAEEEVPPFTSTVPADHINDVGDDILGVTLSCAQSGKRYKIVKEELAYYRSGRLPVPRVSPLERLKLKAGIYAVEPLRDGKCSRCSESFVTAVPHSGRRILCERCYQEARN